MTKRKFAVGQQYIVKNSQVETPTLCRIVVLTSEPGRLIGVKLANKVPTGHDLAGRVEQGFGVWAHPDQLFAEEEFKARQLKQSPVYSNAPSYVEYQALEYDPVSGAVVEAQHETSPAVKPAAKPE